MSVAANQIAVSELYVALLGRNPDQSGYAFWVNQMNSGTSQTTLANEFAYQPEFYNTYAQQTTTTAVSDFYTNVFGRPADSGGLTFWSNYANNLISEGVSVPQAYAQTATAMVDYAYTESNADGVYIQTNVAAATAAGTAPPSTPFTLTSSVDTVVGHNLAVIGTGTTFTALDNINVTGTANSLTVNDQVGASASGVPAGVVVNGVETFNLKSIGTIGTVEVTSSTPQELFVSMPNTAQTQASTNVTFAQATNTYDNTNHVWAVYNSTGATTGTTDTTSTTPVGPVVGDVVSFTYGTISGSYVVQAGSSGNSSQINTANAFVTAFNNANEEGTYNAVASVTTDPNGNAVVNILQTTTAQTPQILAFQPSQGATLAGNNYDLPAISGFVSNPSQGANAGDIGFFTLGGIAGPYQIGATAQITASDLAGVINTEGSPWATAGYSAITGDGYNGQVYIQGPDGVAYTLSFNTANQASDLPVGQTIVQAALLPTAEVVYDVSGFAGLTQFNATSVGGADIKLATTTNLNETNTESGTILINGGLNDSITTDSSMVTVSGAAGNVFVTQTAAGGDITITGGINDTVTAVTSNVTISGSTGSVSVIETATGLSEINVIDGTNIIIKAAGIATTGGYDQYTYVGTDSVNAHNPTGTITVTTVSSGTGYSNSEIYGGTNITVYDTSSNTAEGSLIETGYNTGTTTITQSLGGVAGANAISYGVYVYGGTTVTINEIATTPVLATTGANGTVTLSNDYLDVYGSDIAAAPTTAVTINQTAAASAVGTVVAIPAVAATAEVDTVTFTGLAANTTVTVNGLTFHATAAVTAAQEAAAFANLAAGATVGSAPVTLGYYSGSFTAGFATGNAAGAVLTATGTTSTNEIAVSGSSATRAQTVAYAAGTAATLAVAGQVGVVDSHVYIDDSNYSSTTVSGTITTISLSNADGVEIDDSALNTLNLTGNVGSTNIATGSLVGNTNTTLALNLTAATAAITISDTTGEYTTINVNQASASSLGLIDAALTTLNISGAGVLALTEANSALATVTVTGAAGLSGDLSTMAVGSINASASTGAITATINASNDSFVGGAGVDTISLSSATISKAITLGSANDSLTLFTGSTNIPTAVVNGGAGTNTLVFSHGSDAVTDSANTLFGAQFINFQDLTLADTTATGTLHLNYLGFASASDVITLGGNTSGLTLAQFASNETLVIATATDTSVTLTDSAWTSSALGSINVDLVHAGAVTGGTVTAASVGTVNLLASDTTASVVANTHTDTLTLAATSATTVNASGNAHLTLTATGDVALVTVNASSMTGGLTYNDTTTGTAAETIYGGNAANTITVANSGDIVNGGAGADSLTATGTNITLNAGSGAATLTDGSALGANFLNSGAGNDTFVLNYTSVSSAGNGSVIGGIHTGDVIILTGQTGLIATPITETSPSATLQNFADSAAVAVAGSHNSDWFQFGGNTYIVNDNGSSPTGFTNLGNSSIVEIVGLVNLSNATFNSTTHGIHIA